MLTETAIPEIQKTLLRVTEFDTQNKSHEGSNFAFFGLTGFRCKERNSEPYDRLTDTNT